MKKSTDNTKQLIKELRASLAKMTAERNSAVAFMQEVIEQRRNDVAERLSERLIDDSILTRTCLSPHHKENIIIGRVKLNKKASAVASKKKK